jgi:hypothetical protein
MARKSGIFAGLSEGVEGLDASLKTITSYRRRAEVDSYARAPKVGAYRRSPLVGSHTRVVLNKEERRMSPEQRAVIVARTRELMTPRNRDGSRYSVNGYDGGLDDYGADFLAGYLGDDFGAAVAPGDLGCGPCRRGY